jgi:SnoaL-like protein
MTNRPTKTATQLPVDRPEEFVAEAERMTNERDVQGIRTTFAPSATWTSTIDGMVMAARGIDEIEARWALMCRFMEARGLLVSKQLVTADAHTVVNEWTGSLAGKTAARGIEVWEFDEDGLVVSQRLYGFLNTGSDRGAVQSLRMLLSYPLTATTFARLRLTGGRSA